jgi:tetratricopeptide (TPR) repeat protein
MKKLLLTVCPAFFAALLFVLTGCKGENKAPAPEAINEIQLKRGAVVSCSPGDKLFGAVSFENSCSEKLKKDFDLGIAMLHSFEYDEAEKVFAKIIDEEPETAIAYWGVAMSNFHPLWTPPTAPELEKGAKAIALAQSLTKKTKREAAYIDALASFYKDRDKTDHITRCNNYEKAMEKVHADYPNDIEAAIFYALSLDGTADPTDKTLSKQKKAATLLVDLYKAHPEHPGIVHYIIHSYDYPPLANMALEAARKYASLAPASAHAQHMPSHIFTRLGLWDEDIQSNIASTESAKCYAENTGIKGHWDEELHGLDYLVYAYLQKGDNNSAGQRYDYLKNMNDVTPVNFKVMYAFAAIPSRYMLENRMWKEAAALPFHPAKFPWQNFPWQRSIIHFARALGYANMQNTTAARTELKEIAIIHDTLVNQKDAYKANQVDIQLKAAEAWILLREGKKKEAVQLMTLAADMESKTQKHSVTPGEVLPAAELLGDMLLQLNEPAKALQAYEADLTEHPNRFNGLYGAASAAVKLNDAAKAATYYQQLLTIADPGSKRPEMAVARTFLKK